MKHLFSAAPSRRLNSNSSLKKRLEMKMKYLFNVYLI